VSSKINPGAVIFTGDVHRLARFYEATTGLTPKFADDGVVVLTSDNFELVIHALSSEPATTNPPRIREDAYIKPFFFVKSLAETRAQAAETGGWLRSPDQEWSGRDFRACEAVDPDGNVIQFREAISWPRHSR
jgi:predicted enzyme related to lactoylglutathione lyase